MTDESRAALIAATRTATIAECQRALRDSADAVEKTFGKDQHLGWAVKVAVIGYRKAAALLETMKSPRWRQAERAS